ncbi:enoyl-CoA hydratase/isomerase family protein [Allomesorhizobium camelthorni]|uniref:Enoyl-CoA hydratase/isomerase family protein n=1 Tax=Allomesorhizobium camelthorni TaxID=475069 RepID=A0A6G4WGZ2_9HYPH|nr:enoyl-CoA hydratase/isomerase family protein [Mesorhizobium camelthorni]NGO53463.1 enoyl-CoA hydratase/isomerase family protein [Mesorhizobium camelthorni]
MPIRLEKNDRVALVTIDRPEAMNALDRSHDQALSDVWDRIENDEDILVSVLTGAGEKAFCSGGDLKSYMPWRRTVAMEGDQTVFSFGGLTATSRSKPIIAAIRGFCIAGGLELALACDLRLCTPDAAFGLAEVKWGVLPGGGGTQRLPRAIPLAHALEMILTADVIDAERAERIGLVNRIVDPDALLDEALQLARTIVSNAPLAVRAARRAVLEGRELPIGDGLSLEGALQKQLLQSEDSAEGLRAFAERRAARFRGA